MTGFWDGNWLVTLNSNEEIVITKEGEQVIIQKNCNIDCHVDSYQECEIEAGIAQFDLRKVLPCIGQPYNHDKISAVKYSVHLSEAEALANEAAIPIEDFENSTNPQQLFVRTAYKESEELLDIDEITVEAVSCNGG